MLPRSASASSKVFCSATAACILASSVLYVGRQSTPSYLHSSCLPVLGIVGFNLVIGSSFVEG